MPGDAMENRGEISFSTSSVILPDQDLKVEVTEPGEYIRLRVRDTGCGMDESVRSRIFEPFYTTKGVGKGTGMGMAAVYGTVKNHKGFISVSSAVGRGTTVDVFLPLVEHPETITPQNSTEPGRQVALGRILLVDDEPMVLKLTGKMLEKKGYSVESFINCNEAVTWFSSNHDKIDLAIIDMIMPDMSGSELFQHLKQIKNDMYCLISSGYSVEGEAEKLLQHDRTAFLQKPYDSKLLFLTINSLLAD
jgi:two-component system cell cycle sensor histidine kinase/response regulator CckA